MSRTLHDSFAKDWMKEFLSDFGTVQIEYQIAAAVRSIDVYFEPNPAALPAPMGILGRMIAAPCLIEPFRNPIPIAEISNCNCNSKSTLLGHELVRQANLEKRDFRFEQRPFLWMISPTLSAFVYQGFCAHEQPQWGQGIYFLPDHNRSAIIAVHQLPATLDTLWLRLLGRGRVQKRAIQELMALPKNHPYRQSTLRHIAVLQKNLEARENLTKDLRGVIMTLSITYEQLEAEILQQGRQEGRQEQTLSLILRQLQRRCGGEVSETCRSHLSTLSLDQLELLSEDLLDFSSFEDLTTWLDRVRTGFA